MANAPQPEAQRLAPLPESTDPELERFRIRARNDIARVFRDMIKAGEPITAYLNDANGESFLSSLLGVNPEAGVIYLDYGPDERANQRALQASQMLFVGRHYQVRVQFNTGGLRQVNLTDGPAFAAPFPDSILRIQRREFYRLTPPLATRPVCRLTLEDGTHLSASIVDISLGGIGIIETGTDHETIWQPGQIIKGACIELPDDARILSDIEVRNRYAVTLPSGHVQIHVGCKFLQLEPRMNAEIQRYIHRVDLERRRLTRE